MGRQTALYKDKLAKLTANQSAMFPMLQTHPSPSTSQVQLILGHCRASGTVAQSVTAQQAEAGESSGPFDHPPMRVKPIEHRTLHPSEVVPDSLHFFNFLRDHVKSAGPGVQWNPFALRTAYRGKYIQIMWAIHAGLISFQLRVRLQQV